MDKKMSFEKIAFVLAFGILFSLSGVYAYGASSSYWDENPLEIPSGESAEVYLTLQNMVGGEDLAFRAEVVEGSDIVRILDETNEYLVPFGTKDVRVNLLVEAPEGEIGESQKVSLRFTQISLGEGQTVQVAGSFTKSFPVVIQSKLQKSPAEGSSGYLLWAVLIGVAVVLIILYVWFRKRKSLKRGPGKI